jgi:Saxitoxin biosynthesis operon protein SxtJ
MAHESYVRDESVQGGPNRSFGLLFAGVFALIGLLPLMFGGAAHPWAIILAGLFLLSALAFPGALAPLNRLWLRFGLLLHRIVSPVVLGIMFFGVITPIGLVMRLLGKDPMRVQLDKAAGSYWIERTPPGPAPETFKDQF